MSKYSELYEYLENLGYNHTNAIYYSHKNTYYIQIWKQEKRSFSYKSNRQDGHIQFTNYIKESLGI